MAGPSGMFGSGAAPLGLRKEAPPQGRRADPPHAAAPDGLHAVRPGAIRFHHV